MDGHEQQPAKTPAAHSFVEVPPVAQRLEDPTVAYGRLVVAVVVGIVLTVAAVAATVGGYFAGSQVPQDPVAVAVGPFNPLVSQELPPAELVVVALLGMVAVAVAAVTFEMVAALMSVSPRRRLLSSHRPEQAHSSLPDGQVRVTVLIPAHDEEYSLPTTLGALREQTRPPDRVVVVADNCTDRTVEIAREMGFEAVPTVANIHKKGGALNQALASILPAHGRQRRRDGHGRRHQARPGVHRDGAGAPRAPTASSWPSAASSTARTVTG